MGNVFYFNTEDDHPELDPEGMELANAEQARQAVLDLACGMLTNESADVVWSGKPLKVSVTDGPSGSGDTLFTLQVSARDLRQDEKRPSRPRRKRSVAS